jgi:hypothetical protein
MSISYLTGHQTMIQTIVVTEKLLMNTRLNNPAFFNHHQLIRFGYGGIPMGYHDCCSPLHEFFKRFLNLIFTLCIKCAVASSSIRILGLANTALTMAMRCFCPPDN